ncbi:MAG: glycoside hydrolase family 20 zincin-like fold domain-containing protein [Planctomycetota bacterium]
MGNTVDLLTRLLPRPHSIRRLAGFFELTTRTVIHPSDIQTAPLSAAVEYLRTICVEILEISPTVSATSTGPNPSQIVLSYAPDQDFSRLVNRSHEFVTAADQGYLIRFSPEKAEIIGRSSAGLLYGLQTFKQIISLYGRSCPCLEIVDQPAFPIRGVSLDVSRGKMPTLETLQAIVARLASFKVNHLQLYFEHTFAFQFNPNIGRDCSPLSADEIRTLDNFCQSHYVELVPSLASFGHMGFILSLPEYRHLAEVETDRNWWKMSWMDRMHGLTLDVTNPESRMLLERMYAEFLPLFTSKLVNVCCDETYDLGRGKNQARAQRDGLAELYLEHVGYLGHLCHKYGKRIMFWGDIIKKYPDMIARIPRETIMLNWGYTPDADYDSTALFCDAGLTTFVCPGTSAWNRVLNDINAADLNIRRYAAAGQKYGAAGLLNTDWGDEGHVNLLAGSWHPLLLGAAMAWNPAGPSPEVFDQIFSELILGTKSSAPIQSLRRLASAGDLRRSWPEFCQPLEQTVPEDLLSNERLAQWRICAQEFIALWDQQWPVENGRDIDIRELALGGRLSALLAERFEISRQLARPNRAANENLITRLAGFADECARVALEYKQVWLARNKPSCLHEVTAVFARLVEQARDVIQKMGA